MKSKILNSKDEMFGVELVFADYKHYQNLMENHLTNTVKGFEDKHNETSIAEEAKKAGENQSGYLSYLLDGFYDEKLNLSVLYPSNFRSSFLTQIISFIEYELNAICKHHHSINNTDFSVSDLKGASDMDRAKKYLSSAAKIDFNKLNPEWSVIYTIRKLRNILVHHQSIIDTCDQDWGELDMFIGNNNFIELVELESDNKLVKTKYYNIIITKKGLNDKLINDTEKFFIKLLTELK